MKVTTLVSAAQKGDVVSFGGQPFTVAQKANTTSRQVYLRVWDNDTMQGQEHAVLCFPLDAEIEVERTGPDEVLGELVLGQIWGSAAPGWATGRFAGALTAARDAGWTITPPEVTQ